MNVMKGRSAMKIKKILIAGVVVTIFNAIVGAVTCGGVFKYTHMSNIKRISGY